TSILHCFLTMLMNIVLFFKEDEDHQQNETNLFPEAAHRLLCSIIDAYIYVFCFQDTLYLLVDEFVNIIEVVEILVALHTKSWHK
ncbi:hypothetical protein ACJX0J_028808, partial [Zea mays]